MRSTVVKSSLVGLVALALGGCGGKGKSTGPVGNGAGGGAPAGDRLPWEAQLTAGASFVLHNEIPESGADESVTVKVAAVELDGAARIYRLDWGEEGSNGPSTIRVDGTMVTINDARPEAMKEPFDAPTGAICYGEDFSNPDGCDDICDADLCLSAAAGIESVMGLYAPGYGMFAQK